MMYNPKMDREFYEAHKMEYPVSNDPTVKFPEDLTQDEIKDIWELRAHGMTDADILQALHEWA